MILEAIFNGEIYPAETVVPKSEKFREAGQAIADIMRYFEQTLSKEDYAKLDKLNDNFADCQTMQTEEHFKYGFTMGVLLMKEIYELPDFKQKSQVQNQQFNIVSKATGISILSICRFYFINYQGGLLNENEPE